MNTMNIGTLEVLCDNVERIEPIKNGQDYPIIRLLLDDADASGLMRQLVINCDPEDLLDYFSDSVIKEYIEKQNVVKSPREQHAQLTDSFLNAEVVEVKL